MSKNTTGSNPFAELSKMFEQFSVPGVDMAAMAEAGRQDIAALTKANQAVYDGMQALAHKQTEMLQQAVHDMQSLASAGGTDVNKQTELVRKAYEKTVADMTDLAEIARKSQAEAMTSITQRATQHMAEMKK